MPCAPSNPHFASFPFDVVEFPYENHDLPRSPTYVQATPHSAQRYVELNNLHPNSAFGAGMRSPWAVRDDVHYALETPTQIHNELVSEWDYDNGLPVGIENTVHTPCANVERPHLDDSYRLFQPPTMEGPHREAIFPSSPTEGFMSRSSHYGPDEQESLTGRMQCRWDGCTSPRSYRHATSLWRHIREKHIYPNAFRCSVPQCEKSFGRMDKLQEHSRYHEGKHCRPCRV